ncbi:hypothetical protein JMJ77_0014060 [Colletotrichum scovillei]|uniref:Uncharacterized protein n=1 Tax=Colletotrichum scovillei TaxID=1209932 RepID=A0A9P7R2N8_9PEZI|nr:hypothetical protein JMJ77_0014060 [Colletotrichum scovillei]KAG7065587.1 hypothetical protein JMJ78_0012335 [Colletotrichum scovillei]KAG7068187.1 hypothetical protein JMJ76_0007878 [Colletotrichum scovillei]
MSLVLTFAQRLEKQKNAKKTTWNKQYLKSIIGWRHNLRIGIHDLCPGRNRGVTEETTKTPLACAGPPKSCRPRYSPNRPALRPSLSWPARVVDHIVTNKSRS